MDRQATPLVRNNSRFGLSYKYRLLIFSVVIVTMVMGIASSFGVFFKPMLNDFGWTRAATSGPYALSTVLFGLSGLAFGRISDRFSSGTRMVVTLSGILIGGGTILMSRITSIGQLYLCFGVMIGIGQGGIFTPLLSLVSKWFPDKRAFANGIAMCGVAIGTATIPLIATRIMDAVNWRTSLIVVGSVALIVMVLLAQFLKGKNDDTEIVGSRSNLKVPRSENEASSVKDVLSTRQFWMICVSWFFYGFYLQVGMVHLVPYALGQGISAITAATLFTVMGIIGIVGRLGIGFLGDRTNKENIVIIAFFCSAAVYWGLSGTGAMWMLYLFSVIIGLFGGMGFLMPPILAERFGLKTLGTIFGAILLVNSLGGALGPVVAGDIFDRFGSYNWAFIFSGIFSVLAGLTIWLSKKKI